MLEEDIKTILSYCKFRLDYFYISKTFERIYTEVIYTSKLSSKLFRIAAYEHNYVLTDMLKERNLILTKEHELVDYWKVNRKIKSDILWKSLTQNNLHSAVSIILNMTPWSNYYSKPVNSQGLIFSMRLLDQFDYLSKRFIQSTKNSFSYKSYYIRYEYNNTREIGDGVIFAFLDFNHNYYLIFLIADKYVTILSNKFKCIFEIDELTDASDNIDDYISKAYEYLTLSKNLGFSYDSEYEEQSEEQSDEEETNDKEDTDDSFQRLFEL